MLAREYALHPHSVLVPDGVAVTFRATGGDVVHGFVAKAGTPWLPLEPNESQTQRATNPA